MRIACIQTPAFAIGQAPEAARYLLEAVDQVLARNPVPDLILLPEVAYPAYYLPGIATAADLDQCLAAQGAPTSAEFITAVSRKAQAAGVSIAIGTALGGDDGKLRNAVALFDRSGREINRVGKQFLWHFDSCWFAPGAPPPVTPIDGVPAGLFICADARAPEIPRRLAIAGAHLLLDPTNWVSSGRDPAHLPNAQPDYLMRVRALENGVWIAAANKVGREADSIVYCGKSLVVAPDGTVAAMASCDRPETLVVEIPSEGGSLMGAGRGGLAVRRAGEYTRMNGLSRNVTAAKEAQAPYVAVLQVAANDPDLKRMLADMAIHGVSLAVLPEGERPLQHWQELSSGTDIWLVATGREEHHRTAWLLHRGNVIGQYSKGHLSEADRQAGLQPGPAEPPLFDTPVGRIAVMIGEDGLVPEVARGLALEGADLIAWPHRFTQEWLEPFVRTRAAENRVFVAAAGSAQAGVESMVADPGGVPMSRTFPGVRQAVAAYCFLPLARHKEIVPGTNALGIAGLPELV